MSILPRWPPASRACSREAKGEIGNAVLMLDLAAQHAREIAARLADPMARKNFDEHIAMIERLLQLAREMALKL